MINLLIVDDEIELHFLFRAVYRNDGEVACQFFSSGEECVEFLQGQSLDHKATILLTDINMPGITGIDLLKIVSRDYPDIRTAVLSACDGDNIKKQASDHGAEQYFVKPIDLKMIKKMIRSAFAVAKET